MSGNNTGRINKKPPLIKHREQTRSFCYKAENEQPIFSIPHYLMQISSVLKCMASCVVLFLVHVYMISGAMKYWIPHIKNSHTNQHRTQGLQISAYVIMYSNTIHMKLRKINCEKDTKKYINLMKSLDVSDTDVRRICETSCQKLRHSNNSSSINYGYSISLALRILIRSPWKL